MLKLSSNFYKITLSNINQYSKCTGASFTILMLNFRLKKQHTEKMYLFIRCEQKGTFFDRCQRAAWINKTLEKIFVLHFI